MFPAPAGPFDGMVESRLPDFRRKFLVGPGQVIAILGALLLIAGAFLVPFATGATLWQVGLRDGIPLDALLVLVLAQLALAFAVLRCNWGLWLTGFATNIAFAITFLFVYYPLVAPPPLIAASPAAFVPVS